MKPDKPITRSAASAARYRRRHVPPPRRELCPVQRWLTPSQHRRNIDTSSAAPTTPEVTKTSFCPPQANQMLPEPQHTPFKVQAYNELLRQARIAFYVKIFAILLSIGLGVGGAVMGKPALGAAATLVGGGAALGCDRLAKETRDLLGLLIRIEGDKP